jgi:hypothetical protein
MGLLRSGPSPFLSLAAPITSRLISFGRTFPFLFPELSGRPDVQVWADACRCAVQDGDCIHAGGFNNLRPPAGLAYVRKTPLFEPFLYKNDHFYQDRLGTNIGKALKTRLPFSSRCACRLGCQERTTSKALGGNSLPILLSRFYLFASVEQKPLVHSPS